MKKLIRVSIFIVLVIGVCSMPDAHAQQPSTRLTSTPIPFQRFYARFRNAVIRRDKQAVASMTRFPFEYGWDAGDEGTYNRRQFLAKFDDIVGRSKGIFRQRNPRFYVERNHFSLMDESDASHYGFVKTASGYRFVSIIVEP